MNFNGVRFVRNPDFIFRKIVEETVLVPVYQDVANMDAIYKINAVGATLWENLEKPISINALVEKILAEYDAEKNEVEQDIQNFLDEMLAVGAVEKVES